MRVVLDTNVLISSLLSPAGPPALLYAAARARVFEVVASKQLLAEVAAVLSRPKLRKYVTPSEAGEFVSIVKRLATLYDATPCGETAPDPGDDFLIDLIRVATPDLLVTGDKAPLDMVSVGVTLIVTPSDLHTVLKELRG